MASQSSPIPSPCEATHLTIATSRSVAESSSIWRRSRTVRSAPSRSALFTQNRSATSRIPALIAWTSSPSPGITTTTVVCARRQTSTSSWPTPTVSIRITSFPIASSTRAQSEVARDNPPSWPRVARERMKTPGSSAWSCMRMRSPRIAPPVNGLVGSTARTPTVFPCARRWATRRSTSVLFPAPGFPVMPTICARPVRGQSSRRIASASGRAARVGLSAIAEQRGTPDEQARGVELRRHVRHHPAQRLEVGDGRAERLALPGVGDAFLQGAAAEADGEGADGDPSLVEDLQGVDESATHLADAAPVLDVHVLHHQLGGVTRAHSELSVQGPL